MADGRKKTVATGGDKPNTHIDEPSPAGDSADRRAHGAHGKGTSQEVRQDEVAMEPDGSNTTALGGDGRETGAPRGEGMRGSAGWGNAASGGSVVDKRSPDE